MRHAMNAKILFYLYMEELLNYLSPENLHFLIPFCDTSTDFLYKSS